MKTSNIIFVSVLALFLVVGFVPQLLGIMKIDRDNKPIDLMSQLLYDHTSRSDELNRVLPKFKYIQVDGRNHDFSLTLYKSEVAKTRIIGSSLTNVIVDVKNDTLFLASRNNKYDLLNLEIGHEVKQLTINNANIQSWISPPLLKNLHIQVQGQSEFVLQPFTPPHEEKADVILPFIPRLSIAASEQSRVHLSYQHIGQLQVNLQEAMLRYLSNLKVDTMNVKLVGKSTVSSSQIFDNNQIQVLNVSGDKDFFRKDLIGRNVQLNVN